MVFRYRLKNTGESSQKFGLCEVCGENVPEVFYQVEERQYSGGWTRHECQSYFGHESCLLTKRR